MTAICIEKRSYGEQWQVQEDLTGKILRATRDYRVTRKVNSSDRSAGSQCHSVFTQA
jgi:hypothetical protein